MSVVFDLAGGAVDGLTPSRCVGWGVLPSPVNLALEVVEQGLKVMAAVVGILWKTCRVVGLDQLQIVLGHFPKFPVGSNLLVAPMGFRLSVE